MTDRAENVRGRGDVVASPHELATRVGIDTLGAGGSAVDAMIAVDAVLGVVAPETCGIGGDLFALVWEPGMRAPATLNASGWAGSGSSAEALRQAGQTVIPLDDRSSVTIPGCVAGWAALHHRFGRMPLAEILAPAVALATGGFPVSTELADALDLRRDQLALQPSGADLYPAGAPPSRGDHITPRLLAATLSDIADHGKDSFYSGTPASDVVNAVEGVITLDDMKGYRPDWVEPAKLDVFGRTAWTIPPNSQGYLTPATCRVFSETGPPGLEDDGWRHLLIEAYRAVAWERDDLVADAATAPLSWRQLLDPSRLAARAKVIRHDAVTNWPSPPPAPGGTAYMCAVGADGQAVSFVQSNFMGIGSGIGAGSSGFFLHNRGAGFDLRPGHPNELAPGKQPLHTLSPMLWTKGGRIDALLGTRGGHQQPQILSQMAAHLFWAENDPATAQDQPRWTIDDFGPDAVSTVMMESHASGSAVEYLRGRGHNVVVRSGLQSAWGPVSVITIDESGLRTAAADPRVDTALAAVR